jgi:hypothetical protein
MDTWKRRGAVILAALALLIGPLAFVASPVSAAQDLASLDGAPVDLHEGTCDNYLSEPAYDGGDVETAAIDDIIDDDEFLGDGLLEDDELGGWYVDLDDDDELDDAEFVGLPDDHPMVAVAETDFGDDVDFAGQYMVALHAGADQYDTILACGDIPAGEIDEAGPMVVDLDPVGDSGIFGVSVIEDDCGAIHTYLFERGTMPVSTPAPVVTGPEGLPVGIHRGTCTDWTTEPAYDVGVMELTTVAAPGEQQAGMLDDGVLDDTDAGFLREDIDDDDIFEIGVDLDADDALDDIEVIGEDADDDGILDDDELVGADTAFPSDFGPVYTVDTGTQFTAQELIDEGPYVVGVHKSAEEYDTLVACGPVLPIVEEGDVLVPMHAVDGADTRYAGIFLIEQDDEELAGYLWSDQTVETSGQ